MNIKEKYNNLSLQVRATLWFFVCSVLQRGISTITTPIFTRLLSTSEYGQFQVFNSWLSILQIIITLQLCAGVYTMGLVKFKEEEKVFTSSLQGLNLTLCLAWSIVYLVFHRFWNNLFHLTTIQMIAMLLMIWTSSSFTFWMTTQRNEYRYQKLVIVTLIVSILKPVVGILLVTHSDDKVTARILGLALVEVVMYSGFFIIQMFRGKVFFSFKYWKYAVLFNLPLIPHYLSGTILSGSDRIMIERMVGDSEAGIYSLAYSISLIMMMVNESLNKTMSPWLYQKIRERNYKEIPKIVYPSLIIIAVANVILIAIAPEVISIFAPKEYYAAVYIIPPVAMSGFVQYLYLCFAPFEFYYEKRVWTTIGTSVSAGINILLNLVCIKLWGYQAAGYTTLISYSLNSVMHYFFMRRVCKERIENIKPYNPKMLLTMSGIFMVIGFLYIPTYSFPWLRYGFSIVLLGIMYVNRQKYMPMIKNILNK